MDRFAEGRRFVCSSCFTLVEVRRKRVFEAMMTGQRIVLDLNYHELMNASVILRHIIDV